MFYFLISYMNNWHCGDVYFAALNTVAQVFQGSLDYRYQTSDGTVNIPTECLAYYQTTFRSRTTDFSTVENQLESICEISHQIPSTTFDFSFKPADSIGTLVTSSVTGGNSIVRGSNKHNCSDIYVTFSIKRIILPYKITNHVNNCF